MTGLVPFAAKATGAEKFFTAFGRFIFRFSQAEGMLYYILTDLSGVSDSIARAIFSGVRAKGMTEFINAIFANTQKPEKESAATSHLRKAMSQFLVINGMRDHLVHHVMRSPTEAGIKVSTFTRASRYTNVKEYDVSLTDLENMTRDLVAITIYFSDYSELLEGKNMNPLAEPPPPWRYKSPPPTYQPNKTRADSQKRKHQRSPLSAKQRREAALKKRGD